MIMKNAVNAVNGRHMQAGLMTMVVINRFMMGMMLMTMMMTVMMTRINDDDNACDPLAL